MELYGNVDGLQIMKTMNVKNDQLLDFIHHNKRRNIYGVDILTIPFALLMEFNYDLIMLGIFKSSH